MLFQLDVMCIIGCAYLLAPPPARVCAVTQEVDRRDVPAPRGAHTATMVGSQYMWLFGGYGGYG